MVGEWKEREDRSWSKLGLLDDFPGWWINHFFMSKSSPNSFYFPVDLWAHILHSAHNSQVGERLFEMSSAVDRDVKWGGECGFVWVKILLWVELAIMQTKEDDAKDNDCDDAYVVWMPTILSQLGRDWCVCVCVLFRKRKLSVEFFMVASQSFVSTISA